MPVRLRSRASRSSRKASQFCAMPRSSSRSASTPAAITPPSRTSTAGSSAITSSSAAVSGGGDRAAAMVLQQACLGVRAAAAPAAPAARAACCAGRPARAGRTWRSARRDVMRSTSLMPRKASRSVSGAVCQQRVDRVVAGTGHAAVAQAGGSASGAARGCPCRCGRCRAATAAWAHPRRAGSASARGCGGSWAAGRAARWCVPRSGAARGRAPGPGCVRHRPAAAPAAAWATGSSWAPNPARLATCSCSHSLRRPSAASNCQAGRWGQRDAGTGQRRRDGLAVDQRLGGVEPARSQPGSSWSAHSVRPSWPLDRPSQARPCTHWPRWRWLATASSSASALSASSAGVGDGAGRDHPHHLAFDRPLRGGDVAHLLADRDRHPELDQLGEVALHRMHRHPRPSPPVHRRSGRGVVSVMSSNWFARRASSKNSS